MAQTFGKNHEYYADQFAAITGISADTYNQSGSCWQFPGAGGQSSLKVPESPAAGAAAGAATGATRSAFKSTELSPTFQRFVQRCLSERGYDVIGWE